MNERHHVCANIVKFHSRAFTDFLSTDVLILSALVTLSTVASIIQQIHYAVDWRDVKEATFKLRQKGIPDAGGAISDGKYGLPLVTFWIRRLPLALNLLPTQPS
jgi:hypothetical protein